MKLIDRDPKTWVGTQVRVVRSTQRVYDTFAYEGTVAALAEGLSRKQGQKERVFVKPPSSATFVKPKWVDVDALEIVE